jgi:hypothetical protein
MPVAKLTALQPTEAQLTAMPDTLSAVTALADETASVIPETRERKSNRTAVNLSEFSRWAGNRTSKPRTSWFKYDSK